MANLKIYSTENNLYRQAYDEKLGEYKASLFFDKVKSHYKFRQDLKFRGNWGGRCSSWVVRLSRNPSIGLLAHEVAHALQYKKRSYLRGEGKWHTKQHIKLMGKIISFIDKHKQTWVDADKRKMERQCQTQTNKENKKRELVKLKKSPEHKFKVLLNREKKLLSRQKRIATSLKKVRNKIKYYEKKGVNDGGFNR